MCITVTKETIKSKTKIDFLSILNLLADLANSVSIVQFPLY